MSFPNRDVFKVYLDEVLVASGLQPDFSDCLSFFQRSEISLLFDFSRGFIHKKEGGA